MLNFSVRSHAGPPTTWSGCTLYAYLKTSTNVVPAVAKRLPRICVRATASGALGLMVATANVSGALGACCAGSNPQTRKQNESRIALRIEALRTCISLELYLCAVVLGLAEAFAGAGFS